MSKTSRINYRRGARGTAKPERRITVRSVRRDPPDLRKLSRAVIALALADADTTRQTSDLPADSDAPGAGTEVRGVGTDVRGAHTLPRRLRASL